MMANSVPPTTTSRIFIKLVSGWASRLTIGYGAVSVRTALTPLAADKRKAKSSGGLPITPTQVSSSFSRTTTRQPAASIKRKTAALSARGHSLERIAIISVRLWNLKVFEENPPGHRRHGCSQEGLTPQSHRRHQPPSLRHVPGVGCQTLPSRGRWPWP